MNAAEFAGVDPHDETLRKGPKCPHCEVQPCFVAMNVISMGAGALAAVFVCQSCVKILSVSPLPVRPANIAVGEPDNLIVRPS